MIIHNVMIILVVALLRLVYSSINYFEGFLYKFSINDTMLDIIALKPVQILSI